MPWCLHFVLFDNDLFLLGSRVLQERRGVAIAGVLSAQCVLLYCMYRGTCWDFKWANEGQKGLRLGSLHLFVHPKWPRTFFFPQKTCFFTHF